MRMQIRHEISEGAGNLISRYKREQRSSTPVLQMLDRERTDQWRRKEATGFYIQHHLHGYFIWNPRTHHQSPDFEWKRNNRPSSSWSLSTTKCIERTRREHEDYPVFGKDSEETGRSGLLVCLCLTDQGG